MEAPDLLIVGGGPAGCATALFLERLAPGIAAQTLILEKQRHPRHKVCAGGLIPHTLGCLAELGIELRVPHVRVHCAAVKVPDRELHYLGRDLCTIVRRDEFDALLVEEARRRGVAIRENEKVVDVRRDSGAIRVVTEKNEYRARAVVGADGSGSVVRRCLFAPGRESLGRAVMCDLPTAEIDWPDLNEESFVFDFEAVADGLKGYLWEFPCWIGGKSHVNLGAYALDRGRSGVDLSRLVRDRARRLGVSAPRLEAFPIRWYDPRLPIATERVLLVGDAAGCDPLLGEGISYAFEYARFAADEIQRSFARNDFGFARYSKTVDRSWMGRKLHRLGLAARCFYGPSWRLAFALGARSPRLQEAGVRWYNGVDGWDRLSGWTIAARLFSRAAGAR